MTITRTARRRTALTAALLLGTGLSVTSLTAQNADARHRRGHGAHPGRQRAAARRAAHRTVDGRHRA